jgi:hypothetical protein
VVERLGVVMNNRQRAILNELANWPDGLPADMLKRKGHSRQALWILMSRGLITGAIETTPKGLTRTRYSITTSGRQTAAFPDVLRK